MTKAEPLTADEIDSFAADIGEPPYLTEHLVAHDFLLRLFATIEARDARIAELEKERDEYEAKERDDALEEVAQWHDAREASVRAEQQAETVRTGSRATGYWSAGVHRDAAEAFRRRKSTHESNTQGGEG